MMKGINAGTNNGNWGGGKTVTNRGYRKLLAHGHPRADRDGYVLEHILVIEKLIGRYLKAGEVVHHRDGNKLNNSVDNLDLFKSHADHLRYEADERGRRTISMSCGFCGVPVERKMCVIEKSKFKKAFCSTSHARRAIKWRTRNATQMS